MRLVPDHIDVVVRDRLPETLTSPQASQFDVPSRTTCPCPQFATKPLPWDCPSAPTLPTKLVIFRCCPRELLREPFSTTPEQFRCAENYPPEFAYPTVVSRATLKVKGALSIADQCTNNPRTPGPLDRQVGSGGWVNTHDRCPTGPDTLLPSPQVGISSPPVYPNPTP